MADALLAVVEVKGACHLTVGLFLYDVEDFALAVFYFPLGKLTVVYCSIESAQEIIAGNLFVKAGNMSY